MSPIETIELSGGYTLKVFHDEDAEAPQDKHSDDTVFLCCPTNRHFNPVQPAKQGPESAYYEYPLYAYIHGGIALGTEPFNCPWDSGLIGSIFVKIADAWKDPTEIASDWVKHWNGYLSGERYGYQLEGPDGDEVDSCWGFDDLDYMKGEAMEVHGYRIEQDDKTERMVTC